MTVVVNSNIPLDFIENIDYINVIELSDYELLPMTCRQVIDFHVDDYDYFIYTENDHLWKEYHVDKFIEYTDILPKDRLTGLIQYEVYDDIKFFPAFFARYEWDYNSIEEFDGKVFATPHNVHQASFILSREQVKDIQEKQDFTKFFSHDDFWKYSQKCKVNTDIFEHAGYKKLICISEIRYNMIHHLPNIVLERNTEAYGEGHDFIGKWEDWMYIEIEKMKEMV